MAVTRTISAENVAHTQLAENFPVLDTMRAVGALAVLTTHAAFWAGAYERNGAWGSFLARLDVGVAVFFVLSGFLLSRPWLARSRAGLPGPAVGRYFWKRFLRIVPAYVVVAVLCLALITSNEDLGPADWAIALTMTDIYVSGPLPYGLTQIWSLATEVAFYVVLPLLMLAVVAGRRLPAWRILTLLVAMVVLNVAWLLWLSAEVPVGGGHVNEWLPAFLTWFGAGIGLATLQVAPERGGRVPRLVRELAVSPGVCWTIALGLLLVAGTSVAGPKLLLPATEFEALTKNLLYAAVGTLVVLPGIFAAPGGRYSRVMGHPALRHLGHVSYGVFLVHMGVLHFVMWVTDYPLFGGNMLQIWLLTLALSVIAAEALYRVVELPAMRLRGLRLPARSTTKDTANATR
ncbi:acyltransferase family protein [Nocardioides sp. GCM10027113]|uniref:acyltransferase family protein n=1 Tax=unclassified Nocardioides TaxID=2615069 RepID=UPI00360649CD